MIDLVANHLPFITLSINGKGYLILAFYNANLSFNNLYPLLLARKLVPFFSFT